MLTNEAMIVRLSVSRWTARKLDKKVTREVVESKKARSDAARVNKTLVAKEHIEAITKAVSEVRSFYDDNTLPWDKGGRILPVANYEPFMKSMREIKDRFEAAVKAFVENYANARDEAVTLLGDMFNPYDYPNPMEIAGRFGLDVYIEPIPISGDFRVNMQEGDKARIAKEIEKRFNERLEDAHKSLYLRLYDVVSHMAEKLSDPKAKFKDSLVENAVDLLNILPKLNVMNDQNLKKLAKEVKDKLVAYEPSQLRSDTASRVQAAADADAVLKKLARYTG